MSDFVHLHTHSHYSLLSALPKIPDLVRVAKDSGMDALALTDDGNLYGAISFYKECQKEGIKPIIGVDAYVAVRTRHDKQSGVDNKRQRLVLLAKDVEGYKNLIKMVTESFLDGFYYKPRIDAELIEKYKDNLICIMPSFGGEAVRSVANGDEEKARERVEWYKGIFGDDFFIEISHHPEIDMHDERMERLKEIAKDSDVPIVAGHNIYYLKPEDKAARDTLLSIQSSGARAGGIGEDDEDFSFKSTKEMQKKFKKEPEALENSRKIADRCNLDLKLGEWVFPDIDIKGSSYDEELSRLAYEGIEGRGLERTEEVLNRLGYELKVIADKGYSVYFLIVGDLLREAHERGIHTTIRGSVAGSLTTYCVGITNVNPLEYKLPFERFLNPERPKAPDIDMDFADDRREEILEYARDKYGRDKVAQIGTFGTMMARGAVRDVARALGYAYDLGDRIAKLIPLGAQGFPMTLARALKEEPDLKKMYKGETEVREIVDMAQKIEGCARHISVHAAGVVISPSTLTDYVPLQYDTKGESKIITQFDMHAVEDAGLVKFDFLGIRNLSILTNAVKDTEAKYGVNVDIEDIPLDDGKTFNLLSRGETIGLFQLNGSGMTRYLMELKPTTIHDINAMVALYRPGPMEFIPQYIDRKHNPQEITYLDDRLREILDQSYGIIAYQDDVLTIAIKLGGYSWLEADKLRKAMGKKIPEEMEAQKAKLLDGFVENGMSKEKASELWKQIEPFASYGFNRAHAASYGRVAYQTAYMKANYPAVYMSSVLTAESGDVDKIHEIITECERMGIAVLPPDINESVGNFAVIKDDPDSKIPDIKKESIRFGLYTIKNFGEGIANAIIAERENGGAFKSLEDFLDRITDRNLNKKSLESLIKCGAMDAMGERGVMLANIDYLLSYNRERAKAPDGQDSLFGLMADDSSVPSLRLSEASPAPMKEMLAWEKELLGLYLSGHPLDEHKEKLKNTKFSIVNIKANLRDGTATMAAGLVEEAKVILTKKGDRMMFAKLRDFDEQIECVVFPSTYEEVRDIVVADRCIAIKGKVSHRNGEVSIIVEKAKQL